MAKANAHPARPLPKPGKHRCARELHRTQVEVVKLHRHVMGRRIELVTMAQDDGRPLTASPPMQEGNESLREYLR
jgi:hypothetical protein